MAWLSGWSYRKEISITGQSGAGTDFQVEFDIGDSAGGDFHLEGHCTNFPQDIEVTDNDGTTLLKFWIKDITADPLEMSVKVADDLGSNQTIYVYYGKSGATTNSNGANTFIQYHGGATADFIDSLVVSVPFIYQTKSRRTGNTNGVYFGVSDIQIPYSSEGITISSWDGVTYKASVEGGTEEYTGYGGWVLNQWYNTKFVAISNSLIDYYLFDTVTKTGSNTVRIPDGNMGLVMYERAGGQGEQEWSFVRKYNSPEPAFSSAGSEETPPTGAAPTGVFYGPLVGPLGGPL